MQKLDEPSGFINRVLKRLDMLMEGWKGESGGGGSGLYLLQQRQTRIYARHDAVKR
jgi:hypothetical protein